MLKRIAINGFGRIGRSAFKAALENKNISVLGINDLMDSKTLAHLLKYDTVYGRYDKDVDYTANSITVNKRSVPIFAQKDPTQLPWKKLKIDVVLECTGFFTSKEQAQSHIKAGAKKVIISAPAKDATQIVVLGTRETEDSIKTKNIDIIVSNASCTTNCISPVMQVLQDEFGVVKAMMTTVHSYTADQNLVDGPHKDLRRARAASHNIVPTSTGAAKATTKVISGLKDLFDGISLRVPTICASISDITCLLKQDVTVELINNAFKKAVTLPLYKGILSVSEESLVSSDFIGNQYSAVVDLEFTRVVGGNLIKVLAWYDNEWAYSKRLVELAERI